MCFIEYVFSIIRNIKTVCLCALENMAIILYRVLFSHTNLMLKSNDLVLICLLIETKMAFVFIILINGHSKIHDLKKNLSTFQILHSTVSVGILCTCMGNQKHRSVPRMLASRTYQFTEPMVNHFCLAPTPTPYV